MAPFTEVAETNPRKYVPAGDRVPKRLLNRRELGRLHPNATSLQWVGLSQTGQRKTLSAADPQAMRGTSFSSAALAAYGVRDDEYGAMNTSRALSSMSVRPFV